MKLLGIVKGTTRASLSIFLLLVLSGQLHATFPGKNGKIAFTGASGDVFTMNPDGTDLTQLTFFAANGGGTCCVAWSPDGRQLVFGATPDPTSNSQLWLVNADGSNQRVLLSEDFCQADGLVAGAWIMGANGANKQRLTPAAMEGFPQDVSPDGQHILVGNHRNSPPALANDIFVMNPDGTGLTQLTQYPTIHHDGSASYSPDGTKIVFTSDRLSSDVSTISFGTIDIFAMNADGSNVTRIATAVASCPQDGNCANVTWGPKP